MSAPTPTNEPLLPRVARGEPGAAQALIGQYRSLVWWLARRHAGPDAEDAVQEIFLDLWSTAERFDPAKASESTWIGMIARRRLIDRRRKSSRRPDDVPFDPEALSNLPAEGLDTDERAEAALAKRALAELAEPERRVILLSVLQGMSHSEIATVTGLPLGTVKTYIRRGLQRVRQALSEAAAPTGPGQEGDRR